MEFGERLAALAKKVRDQRSMILTEEATKNAFVMPFISTILGYDVFNPLEVIPEFVADVGIKKGEKIDYAVMHNGAVQILIECKKSVGPLRVEHASQLFRYFAVTNARIAVLTNGEVYQFFTDLDAPNKMDEKPFLVFDLNDIDVTLVPEIRKLSKEVFDLDSILSAAGELKYIGRIKRELAGQFKQPDAEWVRYFATRVYEGSYTAKVREQFTELVTKASSQFLNEQVNERLKAALGTSAAVPIVPDSIAPVPSSEAAVEVHLADDDEIVTTAEELEGLQIVRAIACSELKVSRIAGRDAKTYMAILVDDNNRKPVARLHFNRKQRYLGTFDAEKVETRHTIESLDDIYEHAQAIRDSAKRYA